MTGHLATLAATALGVASVAAPRHRSRFEQTGPMGVVPSASIPEESVEVEAAPSTAVAGLTRPAKARPPVLSTPPALRPAGDVVPALPSSTRSSAPPVGSGSPGAPPVATSAGPDRPGQPAGVAVVNAVAPMPQVLDAGRTVDETSPQRAPGPAPTDAGRPVERAGPRRSAAVALPATGVLVPAPLPATAPPPFSPLPPTSASLPAATAPARAPDVHVTIGRLEVRTTPGGGPRQPTPRSPSGLRSLQEYGAERGLAVGGATT